MFKKLGNRFLISLILLWLILVLVCFWFLYISSDAAKEYQHLMEDSDRAKKKRLQEESHAAQQTRYQVSKQILYKKDLHRLQSRLISEFSELIYLKEEGKLVERFKGLTCAMQEKLMDASNLEEEGRFAVSSAEQTRQMMRQLKAKEAIYSYKSGLLEAEEVEIADYLLSGHVWPNAFHSFSPFLQGQAQTIQLSLFEETHVKVQGFQAIFHSWREEW